MNRAKLTGWCFELHPTGEDRGKVEYVLRGIVSGHPRIPDGVRVHTTAVEEMQPEDAMGRGYLVRTAHTLYRIHTAQCDYRRCRPLWEQIQSSRSCPEWMKLWIERLPDFAQQYVAPGWEDIREENGWLAPAFHLLDWWLEQCGTSICLNGLVWKHEQLTDGSELCAMPVSRMEEEPAGTFLAHTGERCCRICLGELRRDKEPETLECLHTLGVERQQLMEELLFWRGIQRQDAERCLPPGAFLLEFVGERCFRAGCKTADGSLCRGTVELWGEASGNRLFVRAAHNGRVSELVFTVKPFSPLRCESWSPDLRDFCVSCRGNSPLRFQMGAREILCPPGERTWVPLPPRDQEATFLKQKFNKEDKAMNVNLFGHFPEEIPPELAEKAKQMLYQIYQTGGLQARVPAADDPEFTVLGPWTGQSEVVLPHNKRTIPAISQTERNGRLEGFICYTGGLDAIDDRQLGRTMVAAALLCEYLFPGMYAELDLKKEEGQETLRFLKGLFPGEDFDAVLSGRMDDRAILEAVKAADLEDPYYAYDILAVRSSSAAIVEALSVLRPKIEDPDNDELIIHPEKAFKLDAQLPHTNNESVGLTFFLLCLRRFLLRRFDFSNDKDASVVQAAMLLNRIRNGGGEEPELSELPEQVLLRLFSEEWELLVQVLAFLAELPAEKVRELTARTVFQRGEEARMRLNSALRRGRLAAIITACREPVTPREYLGRHFVSCRYEDIFRETEDSARCRGLAPQDRKWACGRILRTMGENGLYVSERFAHEVLTNGPEARSCYAVLLVVELLAEKPDGGFDREKVLEILDEADGWLRRLRCE